MHSFVETPSQGDNIYKFQVSAVNCCATIELPSYYKWLNCNTHVHVSSVGHFGSGYGKLSLDETKIDLTTTEDGKYDVILLGTRKDENGVKNWSEPEEEDMDIHKIL